MNPARHIAAQLLAELSAAGDEPGLDLQRSADRLAEAAAAAVSSYRGLTLIAAVGQDRANLFIPFDDNRIGDAADVREHPVDEIRSSLLIPDTAIAETGGSGGVTIILYASRPGALVDLAADLSWITGLDLGTFLIDAHLDPPPVADTRLESGRLGDIQQAIGVLIARGSTPEAAERHLDRAAAAPGSTRHLAALAILATLAP